MISIVALLSLLTWTFWPGAGRVDPQIAQPLAEVPASDKAQKLATVEAVSSAVPILEPAAQSPPKPAVKEFEGERPPPLNSPLENADTKLMPVEDLADTISRVMPAVVRVDTPAPAGSGFVVDPLGLVVTNYHVVADTRNASIVFGDGHRVRVVGFVAADPSRDLVILKGDPSPHFSTPVEFADQPVRQGQKVVALGTPQGLGFSASDGIVSAMREHKEFALSIKLPPQFDVLAPTLKLVQSTAPISPGSSGGPLFDYNGKLVGVNTFTVTLPGSQNLNFAVSAEEVRDLIGKAVGLMSLDDLPRPAANLNAPPPLAAAPPQANAVATQLTEHLRKILEMIHGRRQELLTQKSQIESELTALLQQRSILQSQLVQLNGLLAGAIDSIARLESQIQQLNQQLGFSQFVEEQVQIRGQITNLVNQLNSEVTRRDAITSQGRGVAAAESSLTTQIAITSKRLEAVYYESSQLRLEWLKIVDPFAAEKPAPIKLAILSEWIVLDSEFAPAYACRGLLYADSGQPTEATADFLRAMQVAQRFGGLDSDCAAILTASGMLKLKRPGDAQKILAKVQPPVNVSTDYF